MTFRLGQDITEGQQVDIAAGIVLPAENGRWMMAENGNAGQPVLFIDSTIRILR
jgi:hypothetical protein